MITSRIARTVGLITLVAVSLLFAATSQAQENQVSVGAKLAPFGILKGTVGTSLVVESESKDNVERDFIPVSVPSTGDSLLIDMAVLVVTVSTNFDSTEPLFIVASPATSSVESRSSTWQQDWEGMSGGFDPELLAMAPMNSSESGVEVRIDVTEIVRRWASGAMPNYGFVLKSLEEGNSTFHWIRDGRYDGDDAKLEIYYSVNPVSD